MRKGVMKQEKRDVQDAKARSNKIPRILIAAPGSGSGKTAVTCALMAAFLQEGIQVAACKCGPDYIDPMFHREVLGIPSENLDLFFCEKAVMRELFVLHSEHADLIITEGVMGYYDGLSLDSDAASSYAVADALDMPVLFLVPCRGTALSIVPLLLGMLAFRENSHIKGILLNRCSGMLYPRLKEMIERELSKHGYAIPVVGYIPEDPLFHLESRHLGLVLPEEIETIRRQLFAAGTLLKTTVDLEQIRSIAESGSVSEWEQRREHVPGCVREEQIPVRIAVARDRAFCFYYEDNFQLLRKLGCELIPFSPLADTKLPKQIDGLLLGGGYPELYAETLSENERMRRSVREAIQNGLPCIAECGGFLYLQDSLEGKDKKQYEMAGVIRGNGIAVGRLKRFGYIHLKAQRDSVFLKQGEELRGHEFHYWDSTNNGSDCLAVKPDGKRSWECVHIEGNLWAGFPHLHFYSNPEVAKRFVELCRQRNHDGIDGEKNEAKAGGKE